MVPIIRLRSEDIFGSFFSKTNNFAFEVKVIKGLESTFPNCQVDKIELNMTPMTNRFKV